MKLVVAGEEVYAYTGSRPLEPGRPSVVFIHGAGLEHSVWVLQSRYFAHHGRNVLCPDLPGHGRSRGATHRSIEAMADWLAAFIEVAGGAPAALVGHSMGALVALETAARHPALVECVALLGVAVPMPVSDALLGAARRGDHAAIDMINVWGHGARGALGGNPAPGLWMMGGAARLLERAPPGVLHDDLAACNAYARGLQSARGLHCPALLLLGETDLMTPPRAARELAAALAGARVVTLPGCGHMMMAEQPDEVLDALIDFLRAPRG